MGSKAGLHPHCSGCPSPAVPWLPSDAVSSQSSSSAVSNSKLPGRGTTKGPHASTLSSQAGLGFPSAALAFTE